MRSLTFHPFSALTLALSFLLVAAVTVADESARDDMAGKRLALGGADPVLLIKGEEIAGKENLTEVREGFTLCP